jgi:hypothetical protein
MKKKERWRRKKRETKGGKMKEEGKKTSLKEEV